MPTTARSYGSLGNNMPSSHPVIKKARDLYADHRRALKPGLSYGHHHGSVTGPCRDGDEQTSSIHIWPFVGCGHEGWSYQNASQSWGRDTLAPHTIWAPCCRNESTVHQAYRIALALFKLKCPEEADQDECEELAVALLRIAVNEAPTTASDCMFHAFSLDWLGIILVTTWRYKNEHEAVELFRLCSDTYKYPGAFYHYGQALIYGTGGVKKDILEGMALLNQAGSRGIAEAYFVLGSVYESGITDGITVSIQQNFSKAYDYYKSATFVYSNERKFEYDVAALKDWYPDFGEIKSMLFTKSWHSLENETSAILGSRFSWFLAGQAFLFGAASALADMEINDFHQFLPLLWLLPILGALIAFLSCGQTFEVLVRHRRRNEDIYEMHNAKLSAYEAILSAANARRNTYPFYVDKLDAVTKHFKEYTNDVIFLRKSTIAGYQLLHIAFLAVNVVFLIAWIVLFIYLFV